MSRRRSDEITFRECFWFPVSTAQARRDVFTGGTLLFTLIFGWIWNMGHRLEVVYRLYHDDPPYFRGFAPWGRTFRLGLRAFVAIALYQAPGLLLMFLALLFSVHGDDWLIYGLGGGGFALFAVAVYALPGGMTYNAAYGDMSYLYRPDKALRQALAGGVAYLKAWAISLAAIALSFLGLLAFGVGFFYTSVWAWSVVGYAFSLALLPDLPRPSEATRIEHLPQSHRDTEVIPR